MKAYRDFEHRKDQEPSNIRKLVAVLFVASIAFAAYYIWDKGYFSKHDNDAPVLIKADKEEIKKAPADPGGMHVPNQDKAVYEKFIDHKKTGTRKAEILLPNPEEPLSRKDIFGEIDETPVEKDVTTIIKEQNAEEDAAQTTPEKQEKSEVKPDYSIPASNNDETSIKKQEQKPDYSLPTSAAKSRPTLYKIQLASVSSKDVATSEWNRLSKKHKALKDLKPMIDKFTTAEGSIFKLSAGTIPSEAEANKKCKDLQAAKQFCFVQKIKP